jgi:hypothetical protein
MLNTTEGAGMTEREREAMIESFQIEVNAAVSVLANLRKSATEKGTLGLYPIFEDITIKFALDSYEKMRALKGY